jgi:hypothetical protein
MYEEFQRAQQYQEQHMIYNKILEDSNGLYLVHGGAGVGKSYLFRMGLEENDFEVLKLAPTGVAANTIGGQTLHRFLGIKNRPQVPNPLRIDEHIKQLKGRKRYALTKCQ